MEYNSTREHLMFNEYGRNIQHLVQHALKIEDIKERQTYVEYIVLLVEQMHPQSRSIRDGKEKLWKQVFSMADFKLNVEVPEGMNVTRETSKLIPKPISYGDKKPRFRHYGQHIQHMITKAISMEDGDKKQEYVWVIASYMKLAYQNWNNNYNVSDQMIRSDLKLLSKNLLDIDEEKQIDFLMAIGIEPERNKQDRKKGGSNQRKKNNKRKNYKNKRRY